MLGEVGINAGRVVEVRKVVLKQILFQAREEGRYEIGTKATKNTTKQNKTKTNIVSVRAVGGCRPFCPPAKKKQKKMLTKGYKIKMKKPISSDLTFSR